MPERVSPERVGVPRPDLTEAGYRRKLINTIRYHTTRIAFPPPVGEAPPTSPSRGEVKDAGAERSATSRNEKPPTVAHHVQSTRYTWFAFGLGISQYSQLLSPAARAISGPVYARGSSRFVGSSTRVGASRNW